VVTTEDGYFVLGPYTERETSPVVKAYIRMFGCRYATVSHPSSRWAVVWDSLYPWDILWPVHTATRWVQ